MVNKRVQNAVAGCNLNNYRMISVCFQGKPFNITVIQVYATTSNDEEDEVKRIYKDRQDLLELKHKRCPLSYSGLECKSRKSRNTWSNRKIWPWSMEWSRAKANRVLQREHTGHSKHPFQQHKKRLYTWTSPDGQHGNQIDYIVCSQRWRSSKQSAKQDWELTVAQIMISLLQNSDLIWRK